MLGDSAVLGGGGGGGDGGSGDAVVAAASAAAGTHEGTTAVASGGGVGSNSGDDEKGRIEEGERSFGGNRWPRQETLALLRIRSDMDVAFRDASVKGPLWEEVSRKLAELGYHRSAKKCKEKFENVYKYHKRTKEGRSCKQDGKTYRFFDQLEALENHPPTTQSPNPTKPPQSVAPVSSLVVTPVTVSLPTTAATTVPRPPVSNTTLNVPHVTVPSTTTFPIAMPQGIVTTPSINLTIPSYTPTNPTNFTPSTANPTTNPPRTTIPVSFPTIPTDLLSNSTSSSTSSDETLERRRKRKRKWKDFFERQMKEVIDKQEELQKRFLEAIEKREHDRMVREEAWRVQEMQRINREREILAQERSIVKDAAVMSFLQKIAEQQNIGQVLSNINIVQPQQQPQPVPQPSVAPVPVPSPAPPPVQQPAPVVHLGPPSQPVMLPLVPQQQVTNMEIVKADNGENFMPGSSSRWPKVEVQALIKLRTSLDAKYQENGPKGPLWEEISASMRKLGYSRSAKRCKEKWENINKYFKKVKESNKKRPEDSKTCPYFHQLDALYRERNKLENPTNQVVKPESMVAPLMVQPEQQWPPRAGPDVTMEDVENDPMERHHREEDDDDDDEEEEKEGEEEEDEGGGGNYEIVASKPATASVGASAE